MARKNERRVEKRVPAKLEIRFASVKDAARVFKAYSLNLSPGGMCIRSTHCHAQGELLQLSLEIGGQKFELQARVVWVQDAVLGVRFEGMLLAERLRLESVIWPAKINLSSIPTSA
jgi:uncharacterized protein (TIGR02266 family)